jgi:cytochrome c-type biogenesis protein CcsB
MDALPSSADLEQLAYRLHVAAFPLWGFTLIAGAIWAEHAWGRYWNWDPKEIWTFVIWVVYAAYLHARATRGWDGRRAAYLAIAGYVAILVNFLVVNLFAVGLHSYA